MALNFLTIASVVGVAFIVYRIFYNLFLHPLAGIPGPRLAAGTWLWLFQSDLSGHCHEKFMKLHEIYGPLIRVSPGELSINDVSVYNQVIYAQNTRFMKARYWYEAFNNPGTSVFSLIDKHEHSAEKRLMSHAFSRINILRLQPMLYEHASLWMLQLQEFAETNKPIPLWHATQCLTLDTVSRFSYGSAIGSLHSKNLFHPLFEFMERLTPAAVVFQHIPILRHITQWFQAIVSSGFDGVGQGALEGLNRLKGHRMDAETTGMIMFESMIKQAYDQNIPLEQDRMISNGTLMLAAGTGTTAISLTAALYHLVARPALYKELQDMLLNQFSDVKQPDLSLLEKVPLLDACVKEALRVAAPGRGRHPRVVPPGGWTYKGWFLPEGTIISGSTMFHCLDPDVYPDPLEFKPERWFVEDTRLMQQSLLPFSYGSRSCIGQNLAKAELYIGISQVVMNFDLVECIDAHLGYHEFTGVAFPDSLVKVTLKPRARWT